MPSLCIGREGAFFPTPRKCKGVASAIRDSLGNSWNIQRAQQPRRKVAGAEPAALCHIEGGSGRILRSASGGRLCVTVFGLLSRFSRYHLLRPAVHKRIPSARPPVRGPAWWSPDLWVPWSAALSAQCGADPSGGLHTAPMPAGSTIISTGIAGGPTVTGNTDRELAAPLLVCGGTAASTNQIVATGTSTAPRQRDRAPRARRQSDPNYPWLTMG